MIRLGETRLARALGILVPGPKLPDETVQSESGGGGPRRVCTRCGAVAPPGDETCPVDGGRLISVARHETDEDTSPAAVPGRRTVRP